MAAVTSTTVKILNNIATIVDQRSCAMMVSIPDQSGSSFAYCDHELSNPGTVVPRRNTFTAAFFGGWFLGLIGGMDWD
jgi:hypothetical protein